MSALPLKADKAQTCWHVRFVPKADLRTAANKAAIRSPRRRGRATGPDFEAECVAKWRFHSSPGLLEFACLIGPSARRGVLWHLSKVLCRNPRRTTHKPVAGGNRPPGICPPRANAWRGWSRRAAPTNGPAVAEQSSAPAAVQPRPQLSCPVSRRSRPADDAVQLQKAFRSLLPLFELPRRANRGQPQAGRGSRG